MLSRQTAVRDFLSALILIRSFKVRKQILGYKHSWGGARPPHAKHQLSELSRLVVLHTERKCVRFGIQMPCAHLNMEIILVVTLIV